MKTSAKIYFVCALLWEAGAVLWFLEPYGKLLALLGWVYLFLGVVCAIAAVVSNRRRD
ncbi:MAG: hypothetical protein K5981_04220 [Clostridia bacterium]|jgi:hypothetical protein|nr:hypothetical protein [Clostridia bacterium]